MSIRENAYPVIDHIVPANILVSVYDKNGLDELVKELLVVNPQVKFYSTGGTGKKIKEVLGPSAHRNYLSVEEFTGAPEMEGGLVKTLHPKIHAGLLAERGNPSHEEYLFKTLSSQGSVPGVYFDVFVGNLYPFGAVISQKDVSAETARVNIDIGGPAMTMASAKNWHSVAVLTDPSQYPFFLESVKKHNGKIPLDLRFKMAQTAMKTIGEYRSMIGNYFDARDFDRDVKPYLMLK